MQRFENSLFSISELKARMTLRSKEAASKHFQILDKCFPCRKEVHLHKIYTTALGDLLWS